ncbi:O-antigen polymerase [Candidatus Moduliflexus flocculans]|uniref:O-antigen polymerase n=1 Tax=Candidatus Moduliflexus flocculans TaxID=1499966 RepID=A0A0S6VQ94_9BACT|nr:O-antigen polymerase [Candidatus Moduliflexus flocculans]
MAYIMRQQGNFSQHVRSEFFEYASLLIAGAGVGLFSAASPIVALLVVFGFAAIAILLYANAFSYSRESTQIAAVADETSDKRYRLLFLLFFLSFFISITIPKSGKTLSGVPITSANILIFISFILWFISVLFSNGFTSRIPLFNTIIVFILYGMLNSILSLFYRNPFRMVLIEFVAFFGFIPAYFLVCTVLRNRHRIEVIVFAIIISLILVCLYGMLQLRFGFERIAVPGITEQYEMIRYAEFGGRWNYIEGGRQKLYSTFQNGNIFGNHLATFLPFLGGIILIIQSQWKKLALSGIFIGVWYTLFLTYSRGALLGGIVGVFALAVIAKKIHFRAVGVLLVFAISLFIFTNQHSDRPELARYNFRRLTSDPNQFSAGRVQRVESAIKKFRQLPLYQKLFGLGLGANLVVDNLYVYLFIKLGVIGFFLLVWTLGKFFITLMRLRTQVDDIRLQSLINGGIAGLIASLVHNIADVLWFFPPLAANFWFLAGISMSIGMTNVQERLCVKGLHASPQNR